MSLLLDFISRNGLDVGLADWLVRGGVGRTHRQPVPTLLSTPGFKLLSQREPISRKKKKKCFLLNQDQHLSPGTPRATFPGNGLAGHAPPLCPQVKMALLEPKLGLSPTQRTASIDTWPPPWGGLHNTPTGALTQSTDSLPPQVKVFLTKGVFIKRCFELGVGRPQTQSAEQRAISLRGLGLCGGCLVTTSPRPHHQPTPTQKGDLFSDLAPGPGWTAPAAGFQREVPSVIRCSS